MARATLARVGNMALSDPGFWKELKADANAALKAHNLELAPADKRRLRAVLETGQMRLDVNRVMRYAHQARPRPRGWPESWIRISR